MPERDLCFPFLLPRNGLHAPLRQRKPVFSSPPIPVEGVISALRHAVPVLVHGCEPQFCFRVTVIGGELEQGRSCTFVLPYTLALKDHRTDEVQRLWISLVCHREQFFERGRIIAFLVRALPCREVRSQ